MAGEDSNTGRFPDPRDQFREQVPDQSREHIREHVLQRTLFGGMSFGARLTSLIGLGLAAIAATGGLFYAADLRGDAALARLKSAMQVQRHVSAVQATALVEITRHQTLLAADPGAGGEGRGDDEAG